jgi:hypothetical protein
VSEDAGVVSIAVFAVFAVDAFQGYEYMIEKSQNLLLPCCSISAQGSDDIVAQLLLLGNVEGNLPPLARGYWLL